MEEDQTASARAQNGMRDARTHVNRQKGRHGIETPRTVAEQVDELLTEVDGKRRRDPVKAAEQQHVERDSGVGGAWLDVSQRVNDSHVVAWYEKLPDRHERRAAEQGRD